MLTKISYETITSVTQHPIFIGIIILIWFVIGIVFYLVIAGNIRARANGVKLKRSMLSSPNAWLVPLIIWILQAVCFIFLVIFPVWARA